MIAKVRISHTEKWCPELLEHERFKTIEHLVGRVIGIHTESMREWNPKNAYHYNPNSCDGRYWDVVAEDNNKLRAEVGLAEARPDEVYVICEHMLEMD